MTDWLTEHVTAVCEGLKRWPEWVETRCETCDENGIDAGHVCENCGGSTKVHVLDPRVEAALALVQRECLVRRDTPVGAQFYHPSDCKKCGGTDRVPRDLRAELCHYSDEVNDAHLVTHARAVAKELGIRLPEGIGGPQFAWERLARSVKEAQ